MKNLQLTILSNGDITNSEEKVLKIASASNNSQSQFFPTPVRVSDKSIADLHRKMKAKLKLHRIDNVGFELNLKLKNDRNLTFTDESLLSNFDTQIDSLTSLVSLRWRFIFTHDNGQHMHAVYVRISEKPNPAMLLQKAMTLSSDDMESFDREAMSSISCRVDFFDGTFSSELLKVVSDWVASLPKAEPTFGIIKWLDEHENSIGSYVVGVSPCICLAASAGIWLSLLPEEFSKNVRFAVAWLIGTAILFYFSRYLARGIMRFFARYISKMNEVPVFDITAGDKQKLTKFLSSSHNSMFKAGAAAILYGSLKGLGLWFSSYLIRILA